MEIKRKVLFVILIFLFLFPALLFADEKFPQRIEWKSNANALEYKVEVQNLSSGKTQTISTDKTHTELSLPPAKYRYRVRAYDFLGKEASVSSWTEFEVYKANKPKIKDIGKNLQVQRNGSALALDVEISDINANSQFELVSESLQGTISPGEKRSMSAGSSETDKITHLDFKNVPPGKWRLKVTNASGLSTLSDVITVEGEKMYTDDEVSKIKNDAEESVRSEMQKNFDDYVKKAEEEKEAEIKKALDDYEKNREAILAEQKRLEEERLAEEKRLEEERLAEEKRREEERLAEERRRKEERLAEERAALERKRQLALAKEAAEKKAREEEKRRLKEEKKNQPYKWKDVIFEGGLALSMRLYDSDFKESYEGSFVPSLNIRAMILPVKGKSNKFGLEACFFGQKFSKTTDFFDSALTMGIFDGKIVWQCELVKSLFIQTKGGLGCAVLSKSIDYTSQVYENREAPSARTYFYPVAAGNLSIFSNVLKFIVIEAGVDYKHILTNSSSIGMILPYACLGLRF